MKRFLLAVLLIFASAAQAVTTSFYDVTTTWQDLGAGPVQFQVPGGSPGAVYFIGDAAPPVGAPGFLLAPQQPSVAYGGVSHVYVRALSPNGARVIYGPVAAAANPYPGSDYAKDHTDYFKVGGSIGNTGFNALQGGAANTNGNPFFVTLTNPSVTADQTGTSASDAQATRTDNQHAIVYNYIYNGTTWDRMRGTNGIVNMTGNVGLIDSAGATWGTDGNPIVFRQPTGTTTGVGQTASNGTDNQAATTDNQKTNSWLYGWSTAASAWNRIYSFGNALAVQLQANPDPTVVIGSVRAGFQSGSTSAAPDAVGAAQYAAPRIDTRGQLMTSLTGSRDPRTGIVSSNAQNAASLTVQGSDTGAVGKMLFHFEAENATTTPGWVVEYDATAAPTGTSPVTLTTTLIKGCHPLPASGEYSSPIRNIPKSFANGVTLLVSSTTCLGAAPTWTYGTVTALIEGEAR